jgi:PAS domain S-box-containing protein
LPATIRTALARQALVEENERAERALQLSEAKYRSLLETASAAIIILDHTGHITMVNPQTEAMFGYAQAALLGQPLTRLISDLPTQPGSILALPDDLFRLEAETGSTLIALTGRHQNGRTFPIEVSLSHTETQDGLLSMCFINDITERKQAEQHVRASLAEKEVLLREIHHRVKNNLQIISSLLDLQSSHILDKETLQVLRESQNRVRSMALIHEMLYQAEGFARIDFAAYVDRVGHHLFNSFDLRGRSIKLNVEISPIKFNLDTAMTCGLILNELISNCLKHAFPQKQVGQIRVAVQTDLPDQYQLIVQDNGVGLPGTEALQQSATIGLKLVETLVSKLKGKLTIDRHEGTTFVIHFPKVEQD